MLSSAFNRLVRRDSISTYMPAVVSAKRLVAVATLNSTMKSVAACALFLRAKETNSQITKLVSANAQHSSLISLALAIKRQT